MRRTALVVLGLAATLAACGKPTPGRGNASALAAGGNASAFAAGGNAAASAAGGNATAPASVPAASGNRASAAALSPLNPGEWQTAVDMKMTGLPANASPEAARAMSGTKMVSRHCLTPEKAARPTGDLFSGKPEKGCSRQDFSVGGGRIHGAFSCTGGGGIVSTMTLDGQYGGDSFDVTMTASSTQHGRTMTWRSHSVGKRIAPACTPGEKDD